MSDTLEIDTEQAAIVEEFLQTPFVFNHDTEHLRIGIVVDTLKEIEEKCIMYVSAFYDINREYAEKNISGNVLAKKYKFMNSYNELVIKTVLSGLKSIIDTISTNTNQQYKNIAHINHNLIGRVVGLLNVIKNDCKQCKQLVTDKENLLITYDKLVFHVRNITTETSRSEMLNNSAKMGNSMDDVVIPEFQSSPAKTPFRSLEHLRNNLQWRKHRPEIGELVDVLETFKRIFMDKFEVVNNYITSQLDSIEYIKKSSVGGKTRRRRKTNKKTKRRRN